MGWVRLFQFGYFGHFSYGLVTPVSCTHLVNCNLIFCTELGSGLSTAVRVHQQRQLEVGYDAIVDKECLFPFNSFQSSDPTVGPDKASDPKSKKRIAAALIERSKNQSIALVPKDVAKLALRFFPIFNPALFPHKPPPSTVANRVLFTDAEDG